MGHHRSQAQFERARWRLTILAPLWALQLALTVGILGLFSWRLGDTIVHYKEKDKAGKVPTIEYVWESTNVGLSFIAGVCTLVEIGKFMAESLTPWTMLFTHVIKLTCASAILALDIVIYVQRSEEQYSLIGLGLDAALIITAIALVIYAMITYRRLSAYDEYARPVNVKSYGFNDGLDRDNSYSNRLSVRNSMDKRGSVGSSRMSFGSAGNESVHMETLERTPSHYSHERDTQFEEYMTRRGSWNAKADAERSVGFDAGNVSPPQDGKELVVSTGTVVSQPRGASINRATSYGSDHVLVAVPEEEVEMLGPNGADQVSLLGYDKRRSEITLDGGRVPQEVDVIEPRWQRE